MTFTTPCFLSREALVKIKSDGPCYRNSLKETLITGDPFLDKQFFAAQKMFAKTTRKTLRRQEDIFPIIKKLSRIRSDDLEKVLTNDDHGLPPLEAYQGVCKYVKCSPDPDVVSNLEKIDIMSGFHIEASRKSSELKEGELGLLLGKISSFKTEAQLRMEQKGKLFATPDFLFCQPLKILVDGNLHTINWLEYKNQLGVDEGIYFEQTIGQVNKYKSCLGKGAVAYGFGIVEGHSGFGEDTVLLDASFLNR